MLLFLGSLNLEQPRHNQIGLFYIGK